MHPRMIRAIFRKDLRDAIRDARVLVAILVPIGIGVFYNFVFDDTDTTAPPETTVAYSMAEDTALIENLQSVAGSVVNLTFEELPSPDDVRARVEAEDADIGLIVPPDFDAAVASGGMPALTVVLPESPTFGGDYVAASVDPALRAMAGQQLPAVVQVDRVVPQTDESTAVFEQLGLRKYFVLAALVMELAMIGMLAVPVILTEEVEKKTMDALVLVASYLDVVVAKALVGVAYGVVAVVLLLGITGLSPADTVLFVAALALLGVTMIGFGLLIGGLFRNASQVNNWSGVIMMPLIVPAFVVGLPLPDWADVLLQILPTGQATRLLVNGLSGKELFGNVALSFAVMIAWIPVVYIVVVRVLSRRQA